MNTMGKKHEANQQRARIVKLAAEGLTTSEIAERLGCSRTTVEAAKRAAKPRLPPLQHIAVGFDDEGSR